MGFDLYPSFIALMSSAITGLPTAGLLPDAGSLSCGCDSHPVVACSRCGEGISARDVKYRDGPGAGRHPAEGRPQYQASSDGSRFLLDARARFRAPADHRRQMSFMVVREGFFGNRATTGS